MVLCVLDPKPDNFVPSYFVPTYLWLRTLLCINNFFSGPIFFSVVSYFGQLQKLFNHSKAGWLPLYSIVLLIFLLFCFFFLLLSFPLFLYFIVRSTSQVDAQGFLSWPVFLSVPSLVETTPRVFFKELIHC